MNKLANGTRPQGQQDQQFQAGRDFYNPNTAQELYDREFNGITDGLGDVDKNYKRIVNYNADAPERNTQEVRQQEARGVKNKAATFSKPSRTQNMMRRARNIKLSGKTSLISLAIVLMGGAGAVSIFGSPFFAATQLRQVLTQDLNDQLKAFEDRHAFLMKTKLDPNTKGACGTVKIACRMGTMSDRQVERYASRGAIVERDPSGSILPNRGRVTSITFQNPNGGEPIRVNSAQELANGMRDNPDIRAGMMRAENPWFASISDKTFKTALKILGTSKSSRISGDTNEERERSVNSAVSQAGELDTSNLTPEVDDKNEPTGRLIGPDGSVMTQQQVDLINESARTAESATRIKPSSIASSIGKGVILTGAVDTACSVSNAIRMVGALAKTDKTKQAAQMAMATLLVPTDKAMAGEGTDSEMEFVGNKINNIGGPQQPDKVVDESKLYDTGTQGNAPMVDNPAIYSTAFDSPGVKAALHGDVIQLDTSQARFSLAGGFIGTLSKVNSLIARVVSGGNPDPKVISSKCKYIQNPYVRGTALIAGIFVGIGSFGTFQAASIALSLGISMALPYAISMAADIASGDVFKNLYGMDFGSGSFVGTAAVMSTAAQQRGMKPLSAGEAVAYTQANKQAIAQYGDTQRYLARNDPFDVNNQYSFISTLASSITPSLSQSKSSAGMMAMSIANLLPTTLATIVNPSAKAANTVDRFQQCEDPGYKSLNIGADIYCNVRYGLSAEELAMDPIKNSVWMKTSGNIANDDEDGQPLDNDQAWNYKKFMDECVNRTVGYGEDQDENQGDGGNCVSKENESLNKHFRVFTMDRSVADYMDGVDEVGSVQTGKSGDVSSDGWAFPTTKDGKITSGYKAPDRGDSHRGVDITHEGGSLGKPIYAARDGKVIASGPATGFGNWIVIEHQVDGKTYSTVYGHMKAEDLMVKVGATVKAGQQIARIGSEGESTGPHLHFEIWNGNRLQPSCGNAEGDCSIDPTTIINKARDDNSSGSSGNANKVNV